MSFVHNNTKTNNSGFKGNCSTYQSTFLPLRCFTTSQTQFLTLWPKLPCEHVCIQVAEIRKSRQEIFLQFITEILLISSTDNLLVKLSHMTTPGSLQLYVHALLKLQKKQRMFMLFYPAFYLKSLYFPFMLYGYLSIFKSHK